jgi:hypothetical protein
VIVFGSGDDGDDGDDDDELAADNLLVIRIPTASRTARIISFRSALILVRSEVFSSLLTGQT